MLKTFINRIKNNKFNVVIIAVLLILFLAMSIKSNNELFLSVNQQQTGSIKNESLKEKQNQYLMPEVLKQQRTVVVFYQPACKGCIKEKQYVDNVLKKKYPNVKFKYHDITLSKKMTLMKSYLSEYGLDTKKLVTPTLFIGNDYMIGYDSDETSGKKLEMLINKNFFNKQLTKEEQQTIAQTQEGKTDYVETWFGKVNVFERSLPILAVTLGLIDGFNPCAMWVLVYLISLIIGLNDKRKIWLIVGSFVFASGVLYYLLMTALLSVFLYIGYLRILQLLVGCVALYIGIADLKVYFFDKGEVMCKVTDSESKKKTMGRVEKLVNSKISLMTILGVIALAFIVNSMEFVCSAALPAIFTSVLTQANLSLIEYHFYIMLYVLFFMLDDLVIFALAAFAVDRYAGAPYMIHCKLIGGIILSTLGVIMLFFPQYLR